MRSSKAAASALALAGFLALAGCAPAATQAPTTQGPATNAPSTAAPAATAASTAGSGSNSAGCADATIALIRQHLASRSDVVSVTAEGGCQEALIETSLAASAVSTGLEICDAVAEVAYGDEISSIRVLATDTKELAFGIKDNPCIGEP